MKRRDFLALAGASAAAWPLAAPVRAQQAPTRRMGFAFTLPASDPAVPRYLDALRQGLAAEGWSEERNLRIDYAWETNTTDGAALAARQLIAGRPDAVLAAGLQATQAITKLAPALPVVFALVSDPVGDGSSTATRAQAERSPDSPTSTPR